MITRLNLRRGAVAGIGLAVVTAALTAMQTAPTTATAARDADPPTLSLRAAADSVTGWKFGKKVELDLHTYAVAGNDPFEIRATRKSYSKPIRAVWRGPDGNVRLPKNTVSSFRGLRKFYKLTIRNHGGKVVASKRGQFCPNGETIRLRPDAPAVSRYPWGCGGRMPFAIGAVWGFQSGHGLPFPRAYGTSIKIPVGKYRATLEITKKYRDILGIPKGAATVHLGLRIRSGDDGCEDDCRAARGASDHVAEAGPRPTGPRRVPEDGPKPDLRSVPAWGVQVRDGKYLAFGATVWNGGNSPLVVDGFRRKTENLMDAYQYFFDSDGEQTGYQKVGSMHWDSRKGHRHWHFEDFARYRLVDKDKHGVVRSKKAAFCLANTDAVDYTVDGANWRPDNTDLHTACGDRNSLGIREVLDSGSGDTYEQFRPGQSFILKGIPNGTYYIEVRANPAGNLVESDTKNNVAYRKVILKGKAGHRKVEVPPVGLIDHN